MKINYNIVISYCRQLEEGWMKFGNLRILKTQKPQKLKEILKTGYFFRQTWHNIGINLYDF